MRCWKIVAVALALLLADCGGDAQNQGASDAQASAERSTAAGPRTETLTIRTSGENSVRVRIEVADEMDEMERGLMDRTALAEDAGMLFVYPEERELSFWMRNTLIPLSIAFMDSNGRIVDIQDMKPLDDTPPHYTSAEPARYALEVNRGFFDERGVEVGDTAAVPE